MTRLFLIIFVFIILNACGDKKNKQVSQGNGSTSVAIESDPKKNLNIQTAEFSEIDTSGVLMFPLSVAESEKSGGKRAYKEMPAGNYWNIIFYNSKTGNYHLLTDRKILIDNYSTKYNNSEEDHKLRKTNFIFFILPGSMMLTTIKRLLMSTRSIFFVSDKSGNNFRQISPSGFDLTNWEYIISSNKVIMAVMRDSDKNQKFSSSDEITSFEIEMSKDAAPKEIFSNEFRNQLKILFDRDWKRIEN